MRASEDAEDDGDLMFEYAAPLGTLTGLASEFDAATNTQVITATGSGFPDTPEAISLYVDSVLQDTLEVSEGEATFTVADMLDETSTDVRIYFEDGLPTGYDSFTSITFEPTLVSISPSSGSSGGTLITATGTGFGANTADVNLVLDSTGEEICESVSISGYGSFACLTTTAADSSGAHLIF